MSNTAAYAALPSNYLGLGCLVFQDPQTDTSRESQERQWQWLSGNPNVSTCDGSIIPDLIALLENHWIRLQYRRCEPDWLIYRFHILFHDVARATVNRQVRRLNLAVDRIISQLDTNPETWEGQYTPGKEHRFDRWAIRAEGNPSLWYLFNTLPSPRPLIEDVPEKYAREALEDLLEGEVSGLRTKLFPYQRRAAGAMLYRESVDKSDIDPRLEERVSASRRTFYYCPRDAEFLREPRYFQRCRGGILSETMGLGKTVMCLSLIQSTKHQLPTMPVPYAMPQIRESVASLVDMAVSAINRNSVPWKIEFERIEATGLEMGSCIQRLIDSPPSYELPYEPIRWNRNTTIPRPEKMLLAATSLIVVPRNLVRQWQSEITKHVEDLRVLVLDDSKDMLPASEEICTFDIVLFSRNRFELEISHGSDKDGRRIAKVPLSCQCQYVGSTRTRDCTCLTEDMLYSSPLKRVHFKRLMVDEGHYASQSNSNAVLVFRNLVTADHIWLVSGTPAKGLLGVEVDVSATDTNEYQELLEQRRHFDDKLDRTGAIESLGAIAGKFLDIKPWSERETGAFREYVYRHEGASTYSGFSNCFQHVLATMVIKTRPEDVELDLPPLHHKIVRLEPSFYDKLIVNLFTLVLTANAVTSERVDQDYIFHKNSAKDRISLVNNLRQSTFWWTGFDEEDVVAVAKNSRGYLDKKNNCSQDDRELLLSSLKAVEMPVLESEGWKAMSRCHELGVFVDDWPEDTAEHWNFGGAATLSASKSTRVLTGLSYVLEAQRHVNLRIAQQDPGEGLAGLGIKSLVLARRVSKMEEIQPAATVSKTVDAGTTDPKTAKTSRERRKERKKAKRDLKKKKGKREQKTKPSEDKKPVLTKSGLPKSSLGGEPTLLKRKRFNVNSQDIALGKRRRSEGAATVDAESPVVALQPDSPYARAKIVGTTSAKMSYLVSQILKYCPEEKILVFYEGDNIAYYIAQMLDLVHVKHEIYAKTLSAHQKAAYVAKFNEQTEDRVLLMDVKHASHGLNIPSASRIYFVNPVCRPDIEAQAIKRAHRIGQTRQVYVETLVLKNTLEEKMLERSRRMTKAEHNNAKALEDDGGIREIIQSARVMELSPEERAEIGQMAALTTGAEQLWGRDGWNGSKKPRAQRRFVDVTDHNATGRVVEDEDDGKEYKRQRLMDRSPHTQEMDAGS